MGHNNANIRADVLFSQVPKIGLKYASEEYLPIEFPEFTTNDEVFWCYEKGKLPLAGRVQFVGQKQDRHGGTEAPVIAAVVSFNQPTCHLAGHLTNPPSNRNLVLVSQLTKKSEEDHDSCDNTSKTTPQLENITVTNDKVDKIFQLIGNCCAVHQGFEKRAVQGFRKGDSVFIQTDLTIVNGKIVTMGTITCNSDDEEPVSCIGVKFNNSIGDLSSQLVLKHFKKDVRSCKECAGDTLAFISTQLIGQRHVGGVHIGLGQPEMAQVEFVATEEKAETKLTVTGSPKKARVPIYFGNCVAVGNGTNKCTVKGLKTGDKVKVSNGQNSVPGKAMMICRINDLSDDTYVGVRLKSSFDDLCSSNGAVQHTTGRNKSPSSSESCAQCEGGKLVFIPTDFFLHKGKRGMESDDGIIFEVS